MKVSWSHHVKYFDEKKKNITLDAENISVIKCAHTMIHDKDVASTPPATTTTKLKWNMYMKKKTLPS